MLRKTLILVAGTIGLLAQSAVAQEAALAPTAPATPPTVEERLARLEAKFAEQSPIKVEIYGRIRVDASYDTQRVTPGNFTFYVVSEAANTNDNEFNLTASTSRVGMNLTGPNAGDYAIAGKVEIDFLSGASENSPNIRMRHAFFTVTDPKSTLSLLAGQTWDLQSQLIMPVIDDGAGWDAGNIGYRRPQIRVTATPSLGGEAKLQIAAAVARTIGDATANSPGDTGEDAGFPSVQGRIALITPAWVPKKSLTVAVSGHWGREEYDLNGSDLSVNCNSYSLCGELELPITGDLKLLAEAFYGKNLDTYLGGIGQGVNATSNPNDPYSIHAAGGWVALSYTLPQGSVVSAGYGNDDPRDHDLAPGMRKQNSVVFVNGWYQWLKSVKIGAEIGQWRTEYVKQRDGLDNRFLTAIQYTF